MRILITGVAGFIGGNLAKKLSDAGYAVIGIDDLSQGVLENVDRRVEFYKLDIRDKKICDLFAGIDVVFHLAAKNCLSDCRNEPEKSADVNVMGTVNVLESSVKNRIKKFVYADTSAEYEGVLKFPSKVEEVCPLSIYATSKRCGALFCEGYKKNFGMNVTFLRYFNVYGPAQDWRRTVPPVMSAFVIKMLKGERPVIYGTGEKRRDFIFVDDVNDFHLIAIKDSRTDGGIYNLGTGTNYSINEIYEVIEGILKTGLKPVYKNDLKGEAETTLADITGAQSLGWKPKIDMKEGVKKSVDYIAEKVLKK